MIKIFRFQSQPQTNVSHNFVENLFKNFKYAPKVYSPSQYRKETTERLSYDNKKIFKNCFRATQNEKKVVEKNLI